MSSPGPETALRRNAGILAAALGGLTVGALRRREQFRYQFMRDAWMAVKRFSPADIPSVEVADIPELWSEVVTGYVDDPQRSLIAALAHVLQAETFFEIGTSLGRTAWTVAHHNPALSVLTLDMPLEASARSTAFALGEDDVSYFRPETACGEAFRDTPEAARITQLWGDSATFDFSPWAGSIDLVYIDGAHTTRYVARDTESALALLAPGGSVIWDDYLSSPGVYRYLTELAPRWGGQIFHLAGTRMAIFSQRPLIQRRNPRWPFT